MDMKVLDKQTKRGHCNNSRIGKVEQVLIMLGRKLVKPKKLKKIIKIF